MADDGRAESGRTRLARGTKPHALSGQREVASDASPGDVSASAAGSMPASGAAAVPAGGAASPAGHAPAQSIREAVEQLIEAQEADEAIAEWMQGGG